MASVVLAPAARREFETAYDEYLEIRPGLAAGFDSRFHETMEFLARTPELGGMFDRRHRFVVLKQFPYVVYYRIDGVEVRVVAVAHSARRPGYWKGR